MAFMAQPWKDPRSGIYYIRRRVPKDVKPHLSQFGEFFKRSLETTCPQDTKVCRKGILQELRRLIGQRY